MLQRAASNAYSWWWASHIRTKQSKWLDQSLQDFEEKVQHMLKLIERDGDSFAKRAEMYYKQRPEMINFIEESYRAYRALAERYDHISTELQNANTTIASVFPEQAQLAMDEEDEAAMAKFRQKPPDMSNKNIPMVPKKPVPKSPAKDLKGLLTTATKKIQQKKTAKASAHAIAKSGLKKPEAVGRIDNLQKEILTLQTEKEYVKSSYDSGLAKYRDIEKRITQKQEEICALQDEFGVSTVIEDDEARTLMAEAALKSCQQTLSQLQEKQQRSDDEVRIERGRIKNVIDKLESLKGELSGNTISKKSTCARDEYVEVGEKESEAEEIQEAEVLRKKIQESLEVGPDTYFSVPELAEKIDETVNKVISLESSVSSKNALIDRLRRENNELQAQIGTLEEDKASDKNNMSRKLQEIEEKLHVIQDIEQSIKNQSNNLQTNFIEAQCNFDHLSEKLQIAKADEEVSVTVSLQTEKTTSQKKIEVHQSEKDTNFGVDKSLTLQKSDEESTRNLDQGIEVIVSSNDGSQVDSNPEMVHAVQEAATNSGGDSVEKMQIMKQDEELKVAGSLEKNGLPAEKESEELNKQEDRLSPCQDSEQISMEKVINKQSSVEKEKDHVDEQCSTVTVKDQYDTEPEGEPNWRELFMKSLKDKEKVMLTEYTTMLRNYKEIKKKLGEVEKQAQDCLFENTVQLRELKSTNVMKDEEIRSLRQNLNLLQASSDGNKDMKESEASQLIPTTTVLYHAKEEEVDLILIGKPCTMSPVEEKLRTSIDGLLEENLDFWLRFSTSFHELHKYRSEIEDLQAEISKVDEKKKKLEGSTSRKTSLMSDVRPIYKHLKEIQTELTVWMERGASLKEELQQRFSSLCNIQEEITTVLKASAEDQDFTFTSYQAAKFQGEILNMKQENNKVADELQAGMDHVTQLQIEIDKSLDKLSEEFGISGSKNRSSSHLKHSDSLNSRVPLHSFIFGVKAKNQKPSIFSCVAPALQRRYRGFKSGT